MTKLAAKLTIEEWPLVRVKPYDRNARNHPKAQIEQLVASIREFGFGDRPIVVDENGVILAGHGRRLAAREMGLDRVPVVVRADLTEAQKRAYRIADNQIALNSEWDEEVLAAEIRLLDGSFDIDMLGFDEDELAAFLEEPEPPPGGAQDGEDKTPEPEARAASQAGDVWLLGPHRVVCGDSTDKAAVEACLAGAKPHLMVTDPPYGVEYDPAWRNSAHRKDGSPIGGSALGKVLNDGRADWKDAYDLFLGDVAYVWHPAGAKQVEFYNSLIASGFDVRMQLIWNKSNFVIGRGNYHVKHEPCWYAVRRNRVGHWSGDRTQSTVWDIPKPQKSETGHGTQKPVECMRRPMINNSERGDAVYDPFLGSGTTLIAAETEGRRCFGIELNPVYVDVIVKRWQEFTGQEARLEATGQTFAEVAADRLAHLEAAE